MIISVFLALANQLSGINAIFFYAKQLFEHVSGNNKTLTQ